MDNTKAFPNVDRLSVLTTLVVKECDRDDGMEDDPTVDLDAYLCGCDVIPLCKITRR